MSASTMTQYGSGHGRIILFYFSYTFTPQYLQATLREFGGASQTFSQSAASSLSQHAAQRTVPPNYSHQRSVPVNSHQHHSSMVSILLHK